MNSKLIALLEPYILWQSIGRDKEPMFFWGPSHGPGVAKKLDFSFADLEPDGCLVADQLASATSTFENPGVDDQKVQIRSWVLFLQKYVLFCDG